MAWTKGEKEEIEGIKSNLESLQNAMRGTNGEMGLIGKVDAISLNLMTHMRADKDSPLNDVVIALYGDRREGIRAQGLIEAVAENTRFRKNLQKMYWMLATAVIAGLGNLFFSIYKLVA